MSLIWISIREKIIRSVPSGRNICFRVKIKRKIHTAGHIINYDDIGFALRSLSLALHLQRNGIGSCIRVFYRTLRNRWCIRIVVGFTAVTAWCSSRSRFICYIIMPTTTTINYWIRRTCIPHICCSRRTIVCFSCILIARYIINQVSRISEAIWRNRNLIV